MSQPLFTIVVPHYQGTATHAQLVRMLGCLEAQTCRDFEVRVYHDGPLLEPLGEMPAGAPEVVCTASRANDWGHALRDRGIREAGGRWIWTVNSDNVLYPGAVETVAAHIADQPEVDLWSFPITEHKYCAPRVQYLDGKTPRVNCIDAMQVVVRRSIWMAEGGWRDRCLESDGKYYESFAKRYRWKPIACASLGEHW